MSRWKNTEVTYLYDNTFEGLLSVIQKVLVTKQMPQQITNETNYLPDIFENLSYVETNDKYLELLECLKQNEEIYYDIYIASFSKNINKEMIILKYVIYYFKYKEKLIDMKHLKVVIDMDKISSDVAHECHKFKGFLRFAELDNKVLFAEFEPKNDIVTLLFDHFRDRLRNEYFVINDVSRNKAIVYDKQNVNLLDSTSINKNAIIKSQSEEQYSKMWKTFFKTIAIADRTNKKCQMTFMPKRFWKHLTEMENNNE